MSKSVRPDIETLCDTIGYKFNDITLLDAALTHRSVRGKNNERLEFLGDSILNYVIAEALYMHMPNVQEGELSRYRSTLVKGDTLVELAKELDIGPYLRLGSGEMKSGGQRRGSILADAAEAIMAAIYLDSDIETCRERIVSWYAERIERVAIEAPLKDPKTRLQEYLQARKNELPKYEVVSVTGEPHSQTFVIACSIESLDVKAEASGKSRRKAEQAAAEKLLNMLNA